MIQVSFDNLETGGSSSGIVQTCPSAVFCDAQHNVLGEFNSFCRPPKTAIFLRQACECHGIFSRDDEKLKDAPKVETVWSDFCSKVESIFNNQCHKLNSEDLACVLVAWNGKACDVNCIWKLVNSNNSCEFPAEIKFFMDPCQVIKSYKSCPINKEKSNLPSMNLGAVFQFVTNETLNDAHDSLADCHAQGKVIAPEAFSSFKDKVKSIQTVRVSGLQKKRGVWNKKLS